MCCKGRVEEPEGPGLEANAAAADMLGSKSPKKFLFCFCPGNAEAGSILEVEACGKRKSEDIDDDEATEADALLLLASRLFFLA